MRWWLLQAPIFLLVLLTTWKIDEPQDGTSANPVRLNVGVAAMSTARRLELRELTKQTWYHAFNSYMKYAFPADELRPLSCTGLGPDGTFNQNEINDVMGGYSVTLIDALDSFVILGDKKGFEDAVRTVIQTVHFDLDAKVQVFEVTIRVMGGLLSAHIYASTPKHGFAIPWYTDELLHLAHNLGQRLLPAFQHSLTGLPWARINLRHGLSRVENMETCSAAAGSLLLEFATLSRLTGDPIFEQVARKALFSLWNRRSPLSLLGNTINVVSPSLYNFVGMEGLSSLLHQQTGNWLSTSSSIGAGIDSFFEYLAKAYILLGDDEYYRLWTEAYGAVMKHLRSDDGFWYRSVNMDTGQLANVNVDSLSAFWPGLQVLVGDVESAIKSHSVFAFLWERFSGSPEIFNTQARRAEYLAWPLRPELVESTLFLYRATKDVTYLRFGERVINDISNRTKVACGLTALENVVTGKQEDRMHSFSIAETLPYLYLLFDEDNPLNHGASNGVFTTEGHYLSLDKSLLRSPPKSRKGEAQSCTRYDPAYELGASGKSNSTKSLHALQIGIPYRKDMEYARSLVGLKLQETSAVSCGLWHESGFCESPSAEDYMITLLFANESDGEVKSPGSDHVSPLQNGNGYLIKSIRGLRIQATRRIDNQGGYDITKLGPYRISSSSKVLISDPGVLAVLKPGALAGLAGLSSLENLLSPSQITLKFQNAKGDFFVANAAKAAFGPSFPEKGTTGSALHMLPTNDIGTHYGCEPFNIPSADKSSNTLVVAVRGKCPFLAKMVNAAKAGASGLIVLSDEDDILVPSADEDDLAATKKEIPTVLLPKTYSDQLRHMLADSGHSIKTDILPPLDIPEPRDKSELEKRAAILKELAATPVVVNGYWLVNCRLVLP